MCLPALHPIIKFCEHEGKEGLQKSQLLPRAIELAYYQLSKLKPLVPEIKINKALSISISNENAIKYVII